MNWYVMYSTKRKSVITNTHPHFSRITGDSLRINSKLCYYICYYDRGGFFYRRFFQRFSFRNNDRKIPYHVDNPCKNRNNLDSRKSKDGKNNGYYHRDYRYLAPSGHQLIYARRPLDFSGKPRVFARRRPRPLCLRRRVTSHYARRRRRRIDWTYSKRSAAVPSAAGYYGPRGPMVALPRGTARRLPPYYLRHIRRRRRCIVVVKPERDDNFPFSFSLS